MICCPIYHWLEVSREVDISRALLLIIIVVGNAQFDQVIHMLLGNPNLAGTILACFLDNTVPGKRDKMFINPYCNMTPTANHRYHMTTSNVLRAYVCVTL